MISSDEDEINGPERDFAINSLPKGKKRLTSEHLVRITRNDELTEVAGKGKKRGAGAVEIGEPTRKQRRRASSNTDLPNGAQRGQRFQHRFIPTVVWYFATQIDPWNTSDKDLVPALQAIWDTIYGCTVPHQIEVNDSVFRVTTQRISDTWHSSIGSSAIAVVNSFFDLVDPFKVEKRRELAKSALNRLQFVYRDTTSSDYEEWKGPFEGPLVVQTFAAHFFAISGSRIVGALGEPSEDRNLPYSALALTAAAVERALKLWADGTMTIEMANAIKSGTAFESSLNKASGEVSALTLSFNETNWGKATREYAVSARQLKPKRLMKIMKMAVSFLGTSNTMPQQDISMDVDSNNFRVNLVKMCADDDDDDEEEEDEEDEEEDDDDDDDESSGGSGAE